MKAVTITKYTDIEKFDNIEYTETAKVPTITKDNEVKIQVQRSCVSSGDLRVQRGDAKLVLKLNFPQILGVDMAGIVEEVGSKVKNVKKGDRVVACNIGLGAWAEYAVVSNDFVGKIPKDMPITKAGAIPTSLQTAFHCFDKLVPKSREKLINGTLKDSLKGKHIMINGASGGVGTCAVLLAKHLFGMVVWAVCSKKNHEVVKQLGADYCIDYKTEDFKKKYDKKQPLFAFIDTVGNGQSGAMSLMNSKGNFILVGLGWESTGFFLIVGMITNLLWRKFLSFFRRPKYVLVDFKDDGVLLEKLYEFLDKQNLHELLPIQEMVELKDIVKGLKIVNTHRTVGKVAVNIDGSEEDDEEEEEQHGEESASSEIPYLNSKNLELVEEEDDEVNESHPSTDVEEEEKVENADDTN